VTPNKGNIRKSNRTDNESAKMATSKGVIQGYTGVAAVDAKHQIIVDAQAHGTGSEQELLVKARIDSPEGRARYGRRFATVEPVFGNLRHNKQLNRFTLRSQRKVDAQWKLYCLVHNIEKLAHHGYAQ